MILGEQGAWTRPLLSQDVTNEEVEKERERDKTPVKEVKEGGILGEQGAVIGPLVPQDGGEDEMKVVKQNPDRQIEIPDDAVEYEVLRELLHDRDEGLCALSAFFPCLCALKKLELKIEMLRNPPIPPPPPRDLKVPASTQSTPQPPPQIHTPRHSGVTPPSKLITGRSPTPATSHS